MKKRWLTHVLAISAALLIILALTIAAYFPRQTELPPVQERPVLGITIQEIAPFSRASLLDHINEARSNAELPPLKENIRLNQSAQLKADDMQKKGYWAHNAPDGTEPWVFFEKVGYTYTKAGENLAKCYKTPAQAVQAWIDSPTHYDNIVGDYEEAGFGMTTISVDCVVIVNHFGKK